MCSTCHWLVRTQRIVCSPLADTPIYDRPMSWLVTVCVRRECCKMLKKKKKKLGREEMSTCHLSVHSHAPCYSHTSPWHSWVSDSVVLSRLHFFYISWICTTDPVGEGIGPYFEGSNSISWKFYTSRFHSLVERTVTQKTGESIKFLAPRFHTEVEHRCWNMGVRRTPFLCKQTSTDPDNCNTRA